MKAYFVDLDDTLFDCEALKARWVNTISENIRPIKDLSEKGAFSAEDQKHAEKLLLEEITTLQPYPQMIAWIKNHQPAFLVTRGFQERQQAKIDALGITDLFKEIVITQDKEEAFKYLLEQHHLKPEEVLVVGDKTHDELKTGKKLGMHVQLASQGELL